MADLVRKRRIRAGHRGVVTRRVAEAKALVAADDPGKGELEKYVGILQGKLDLLRQLDGEILDLLEDEADITREIEQTDIYNQELVDLQHQLKQCLEKVTSSTGTSGARATPSTDKRHAKTNTRLPKLTLKSFDGDITYWLPFWDCYEAAVHSNTDLSDVQKFTYLKSLVDKSAREAINGLSLSAENYANAIEILQKRFGNKQRIIAKHMEILLNIEQVSSPNNIVALRRLYDRVESNIRALGTLGVTSESYGTLLSSVLVKKLPQEFRLMVSRRVSDEWNLTEIMETVGKELEARERAATPKEGGDQPSHTRPGPTGKPSVHGLLVGHGTSDKSCPYCKAPHSALECTIVESPEERKRCLRRDGRCFSCLRKGHMSRECRSKWRCRTCNGKHHTSVCESHNSESTASRRQEGGKTPSTTHSSQVTQTGTPSQLNPVATPFNSNTTAACCLTEGRKTIMLQSARAILQHPWNPEIRAEVPIIFDTGSHKSYVCKATALGLQLPIKEKKHMTIMTFGTTVGSQQCCEVVQANLCKGSSFLQSVVLHTVPTICNPLNSPKIPCLLEHYPQLQELELADPGVLDGTETRPVVLIGLDYYWKFMSSEVIRFPDGPVAIHSNLGWVLSGPSCCTVEEHEATTLTTHTLRVAAIEGRANDRALERQLKSFWELESLGIVDKEEDLFEQFQRMVKLQDGRYEVMLPWKDPTSDVPSNYDLSLKRLRSLVRRLAQNPELRQRYSEIIKEQEGLGIIERVNNPGVVAGDKLHYLPHHPVVRSDHTTTKVRVVFDASSKANNHVPSLNECLHIGPKFNQRILDILIRFRTHRTAFIADIEKAFLMISVNEKDREALRFLWTESLEEPLNPQVYRFTRVVFGVASSPFLLNATLRHHLNRYIETDPVTVESLKEGIYVDDVVSGAETSEAACQLYLQAKRILSEGSFNLRKFQTHDEQLCAMVAKEEEVEQAILLDDQETYAKITLGKSVARQPGEQKVLGVRWRLETDQLVLDLQPIVSMMAQIIPTKRNIVSIIGKIYDPLGILSPVVIRFKMFLQEICLTNYGWDTPISDELRLKWQTLVAGVSDTTVVIPRCVKGTSMDDTNVKYRLCGFGDASSKAYAAVVYLITEEQFQSHCRIICSKTRVTPTGNITIPRLELLSALLVARLVTTVTHSLIGMLTLESPWCFLDSKVAYHWIRGRDKGWRPFVQNRVNEIRRLIPENRWRHCNGVGNPADWPSRGQTLLEFSNNQQWFDGPIWLEEWLEKEWSGESSESETVVAPSECLAELKTSITTNLLNPSDARKNGIGKLVQLDRYSDVTKLYRVTAYVLVALRVLRRQGTTQLTTQQLERAENLWIREVQTELSANPSYLSTLWGQLGLFTDDEGLIRCRGRLKNVSSPYSTRFPVLLPQGNHLTTLIIRQAHQQVFHNGVKETLTQVRTRYWIVRGRSAVKQVIRRCVLCRRMEGLPYLPPPPPPLPTYRVEEVPPFTHTGVDFAGPLYVRMTKSAACVTKAWICLYTCCSTRAVHLDVVLDMTTQSFIRSFKRFSARRGLPHRMISDNGKTFKAAAKTIRHILKHPSVQEHLTNVKVDWTFNIERAPWWGGMFERLVRSTKRCLRKITGRAKLTYDELLTVLCEIESVINSRPLSYVSANDLEEPLTPAHLMVGRRLLSLPDDFTHDSVDEDYQVTPQKLTRRMEFLQRMMNRFWSRWKKEYLLELRSQHSLRVRNGQDREIDVGDVVIIHSDSERRGFWRLGLIERLIQGNDGQVRGAKVRVSSTNGSTSTWQRPVQLLYPLEVNQCRSLSSTSSNLETPNEIVNHDTSMERSTTDKSTLDRSEREGDAHPIARTTDCRERSRRPAATEAMNRIRKQLND